jgi:hypothetical protein
MPPGQPRRPGTHRSRLLFTSQWRDRGRGTAIRHQRADAGRSRRFSPPNVVNGQFRIVVVSQWLFWNCRYTFSSDVVEAAMTFFLP